MNKIDDIRKTQNPNFVPGPGWPGRIPTEREIARGATVPPHLMTQKSSKFPEFEKWDVANPEKPLTPKEKIVFAAFEELVTNPVNLHTSGYHFPKLSNLRVVLQEAGYGEEMTDALDDGFIEIYFQKYLKVCPNTKWHETVENMTKKKKE